MTNQYYVINQHYSGLKYCPPHEAERKIESSITNEDKLKFWIGERDGEYYARKYIAVYEAELQRLVEAGKLGTKEHRDCLYFRGSYVYRLMEYEKRHGRNYARDEAIEALVREAHRKQKGESICQERY